MTTLTSLTFLLRNAASYAAPMVMALALAPDCDAQITGQLSTQPSTSSPMTIARAISELGDVFRAPGVPEGMTGSGALYCASYSRKYADAAAIANAAAAEARRAAQADANSLPGAGNATYLALVELGRGFTAVSRDFADGDIDRPANFSICASGFTQLSMVLPLLHSNLAAASTQMQDIAGAFSTAAASQPTTIELSEDIITLGILLLKKIADLPRELDPEALEFPTPLPMDCPTGWVMDCTIYRTLTYSIISLQPWEPAGWTTPCLWLRGYAVQECVIEKCICYCYPSEIHRFFGIGGIRHSKTLRNLGCTTVSIEIEWEWECGGPPPANPPAAPTTRTEVEGRRGCR